MHAEKAPTSENALIGDGASLSLSVVEALFDPTPHMEPQGKKQIPAKKQKQKKTKERCDAHERIPRPPMERLALSMTAKGQA